MEMVRQILVTFAVTFVTAVVVTFLWSLVFAGAGSVDWETALVLAIAIGVAVPVAGRWHAAGE